MDLSEEPLWHGVGARLHDIRHADKGKPRKRICVLGAGIAGLVASYELCRLGHEVVLLEASSRIGGRVWTHRFSSGEYGELGAMRIPGSHDYTRHYVREMNLSLRPFVGTSPNAFCNVREKAVRWSEVPSALLSDFNLTTSEEALVLSKGIGAMLAEVVAQYTNKLTNYEQRELFKGRISTSFLRFLDATTVRHALAAKWSQGAVDILTSTTSLDALWSRPIIKYVRDALTKNGVNMSEIVGGMDLLPKQLKLAANAKVEMGVEVRGLALKARDDCMITTLTNGDLHEHVSLDAVLCTIPFSVLRRMKLRGLGAAKMRAISGMGYVSATKVLLHSKTRFWETNYSIIGGRSVSDSIIRQTFYPSDNTVPEDKFSTGFSEQNTSLAESGLHVLPFLQQQGPRAYFGDPEKSVGPGCFLGSYSWGADARRIAELKKGDRAALAMREISSFHPEVEHHIDAHESMSWDTWPWSLGGYGDLAPMDLTDYYADAVHPVGNVYFAGEHVSPFPGWIQGAAYSALLAVRDIVAA